MQEARYLKTIATNRKVDLYRNFRDEVRPARRNRDYKVVSAVGHGSGRNPFFSPRNAEEKQDDCDASYCKSLIRIGQSLLDSTRSLVWSLLRVFEHLFILVLHFITII